MYSAASTVNSADSASAASLARDDLSLSSENLYGASDTEDLSLRVWNNGRASESHSQRFPVTSNGINAGRRFVSAQVERKPRNVRFAPSMADHDNIYDDEVIRQAVRIAVTRSDPFPSCVKTICPSPFPCSLLLLSLSLYF